MIWVERGALSTATNTGRVAGGPTVVVPVGDALIAGKPADMRALAAAILAEVAAVELDAAG